jgi:hypothetical protein
MIENFDLIERDVTPPPAAPQAPTLRAGELVYVSYIPRGKAEPEPYPAIVIFQHDGNLSFVMAELIDGVPRPRQGRIDMAKVSHRETPHEFDNVASGLLMVLKNQKIMNRFREAALSDNRAKETLRREADRRDASIFAPGGCPQTPMKRRRF